VTAVPFPQASFTEFIGARVQQVDEGVCRLSLIVEPRHLDGRGVLHTGVLTSMMDATIGIGSATCGATRSATAPRHDRDERQLLGRSPSGDEIEVEGRVIRRGRSIAFGEAVARRRPDGETLALSRLTFAISSRSRSPSVAQGPSLSRTRSAEPPLPLILRYRRRADRGRELL
jgi:acyl-CoA thioesterase